MFWKIGKPGATEFPRAGSGHWSISKRLALLHILAVLISYTVFGVLLYATRIKQLERDTLQDLDAERASVVAMMSEPDAKVLLGYEIRTQQFEPENLRPFFRILDREGRVLLESLALEGPSLEGWVPRGAFPPPGAALRWRNGHGGSFLLKSYHLPDRLFSGPGATLQLGINTHEQKALGHQLFLTLLAFVSSGMLFAFGCAYLIVRLALKPLDDISSTASNITRHRLDTRIDDSALPAELVSLAGSFNSMLGRLEDSFSRLSHYSANLAHELRTPINNLMIESDIALAKERTPQEYQQVIASGLEEYRRLSWIVDRLLFLARADLEAPELDRQRLELRSEIEEIFDYYSDSARESGVTLKLVGDAVLCADQTLLRRAISNLVSNAIAHTPNGGAIVVTLEQAHDLSVRVTVSDTGCGIDEAHLPSIFDRFYRAGANKQSNPSGAGLGLAIVKAITQMHGGSVAVESTPGKGTRLTLQFPAAAAPIGPVLFN
jgi:two-component system, OmpR family, heavy metal sensor histidine kinase CusS